MIFMSYKLTKCHDVKIYLSVKGGVFIESYFHIVSLIIIV